MTKRGLLFTVFLLLLTLPVLSDGLPRVLQPNETAYSASEVATLTQAITTLETTLNNYNLGSRRYFTSNDWNSRDFAAYTAGSLTEMGYETVLVSGAGWPEGTHTWVLVGIPLGAETAWVPVEASPEAGHSQQILGHIPSITDTAGNMWYEERYLNFSDVIELGPNLPPVAKIRPPIPAAIRKEKTRLLTLGSYDPDGEIVLYQWSFGDGDSDTTTRTSIRHEFEEAKNYTLSLTVIDSRGKSVTASITLRVIEPSSPGTDSSSPSGGCGCGG